MSVCLPPESIPGMPQIVRDRLGEGIETIAERAIFGDYGRTRGTGLRRQSTRDVDLMEPRYSGIVFVTIP